MPMVPTGTAWQGVRQERREPFDPGLVLVADAYAALSPRRAVVPAKELVVPPADQSRLEDAFAKTEFADEAARPKMKKALERLKGD